MSMALGSSPVRGNRLYAKTVLQAGTPRGKAFPSPSLRPFLRGPLEPTHLPKLREKVADFPWLHFNPLTRSILLWRPAAEVWYGHSAIFTPPFRGGGTAAMAPAQSRAAFLTPPPVRMAEVHASL